MGAIILYIEWSEKISLMDGINSGIKELSSLRRLEKMKYGSPVEYIIVLIVEEYFFHCNAWEGKRVITEMFVR